MKCTCHVSLALLQAFPRLRREILSLVTKMRKADKDLIERQLPQFCFHENPRLGNETDSCLTILIRVISLLITSSVLKRVIYSRANVFKTKMQRTADEMFAIQFQWAPLFKIGSILILLPYDESVQQFIWLVSVWAPRVVEIIFNTE